jgi:putative (di)nucleoside polyphosphate hydrolase
MTSSPDLSLYRPNVGVVLFNADGKVWYGRRHATEGPYNWQFPQGGVDKGEDSPPPPCASFRKRRA